jgi:hypothetical protein
MAHRVPQTEAQHTEQHQAENDRQQRPGAQRELGVAPGFRRLRLLVVKRSVHARPQVSGMFRKAGPLLSFGDLKGQR